MKSPATDHDAGVWPPETVAQPDGFGTGCDCLRLLGGGNVAIGVSVGDADRLLWAKDKVFGCTYVTVGNKHCQVPQAWLRPWEDRPTTDS